MMRKIGIVGPTRSVERILVVAQKFDHDIDFVPLTFEDENDIAFILRSNQAKVDGWLLAGTLTYELAKKHLTDDDNVAYCQSTGAGFYINCLQIAFEHKHCLQRISVDLFESLLDIERTLDETGLPWQDVYIKYYNEAYDAGDIVDFHLNLWREGKIDGAVTALRCVFHSLQKHGVPVYTLTLTECELYQSLKMIIEKVKVSYFRNTQVGLVIIEIGQYDKLIERSKTPYALEELKLKLKGILLPLCKALDGYLVDVGSGIYEIFSSRGAVGQQTSMLQAIICELHEAAGFDVPVAAGVGYGETVFAAEINAHRALRNAREQADNAVIIVQDDGMMVELKPAAEQLCYSYCSNDVVLLEKLHQAAVGIKTYRKIETAVQQLGRQSFTVAQLAAKLAVTQQNIRRIMSGLCLAGLAVYAGEQLAEAKGRPGKLYKLVL